MNETAQAAGLLEVYGFATALMAIDAACKAASVTVGSIDKNKPANAESLPVPLLIMIKFRGSLSDVREALHAGGEAAKLNGGLAASHILPKPDGETERILSVNEIK